MYFRVCAQGAATWLEPSHESIYHYNIDETRIQKGGHLAIMTRFSSQQVDMTNTVQVSNRSIGPL